MANIAQSFLAGRQARLSEEAQREASEFRGIQMEQMMREETNRRRIESKTLRLQEVVQGYLTAGPEEQAPFQEELMGTPEGRGQLQDIRETRDYDRNQALQSVARWAPVIQTLEGAERQQANLYLASEMEKLGKIGRGVAKSYLQAPPEEQNEMINAILGKEAKVPTGDYQVYQKSDDPEDTILVNEAMPEDQALLAENRHWKKAPTTVIQGTPADFESSKVADDMGKIESATRNFIADIYEAQDFVRDNPAALTDVAGLARVGTYISANIDALRTELKVDLESEAVLDATSYFDELKELGITSAEMSSITIGLAAQQAIINNPGGRISDRDMKTAIKQVGANVQEPEGFIRVTGRLARRADRVFRNQYKSRSKEGKDFVGDLGLRKPETGPTRLQDAEGRIVIKRDGGWFYEDTGEPYG